MTAILGYADGEHVWMAGDSAVVNGSWRRYSSAEKKVYQRGDILFGVGGRAQVSQVLRYGFEPPEHNDAVHNEDYVARILVNALRTYLDENKCPLETDDSSTAMLFGYHGELYYMTGDYTVSKPAARSFAIGTGGDLAFGAFHALLKTSVQSDQAMLQALEISAEFNLSVAPPFYVLTL